MKDDNSCICVECNCNNNGKCIVVASFCKYRNKPELEAAYDDGYNDGYNDAY